MCSGAGLEGMRCCSLTRTYGLIVTRCTRSIRACGKNRRCTWLPHGKCPFSLMVVHCGVGWGRFPTDLISGTPGDDCSCCEKLRFRMESQTISCLKTHG